MESNICNGTGLRKLRIDSRTEMQLDGTYDAIATARLVTSVGLILVDWLLK